MDAPRVVYLRGRRFRSFHGRRDALCARACSVAHRLDRVAPRCVAFLNLLIERSIGLSHRNVLILYGGPLYETDLSIRSARAAGFEAKDGMLIVYRPYLSDGKDVPKLQTRSDEGRPLVCRG